jgi:uncharacterized protein (TIGR03086 family)
MDLNTLYHRTVESWADRVNAVGPDQWDAPTPCSEWTVRDLANHVAGEDLWTSPLMRGSTIEEVGNRFDGDLLGADPIGSALAAAKEAVAAVAETLPQQGKVHLSYGDEDAAQYVHQLAADHLVHGWDLAVATGRDPRLDPALVAEVAAWFAGVEDMYRAGGAIGPRAAVTGDPQANLLAAFGRDARWGPNHACLTRFMVALGRGDVDAMLALVTDDVVFETTTPPDGERFTGKDAVREQFVTMFANTVDPVFKDEATFHTGDRAAGQWTYSWTNPDGSAGHVRGVDVVRFRDGLICESAAYVKG